MTSRYVLSIDQGTTSTRAMVFDRNGRLAGMGQREHRQIFPRPGWVEHDAAQIWANTRRVIPQALADLGISVADVAAVGVASQRETFVLWERDSGRPVCPAIVWQDTRSQLIVDRLLDEPGADFFRSRAGIPPAAYFTAPRLSWLMETHPDLRVRHVVTLGTPHQGSSALPYRLIGLPARTALDASTDVIAIYSDFDTWLAPVDDAYCPHGFNIAVRGIGRAFVENNVDPAEVRAFLDDKLA